jgi:hypothetical protein
VRSFIQAMIEGELDAALMRPRYGRRPESANDTAAGLIAVGALCAAIGQLLGSFTSDECANYFRNAGCALT